MTGFFIFALATIGLTNIIIYGTIFDTIKIQGKSLREWSHYWEWSEQLFTCPQCLGFWTGMICGFAVLTTEPFVILACGFAGSVLSEFYRYLIDLINNNITFEVEQDDETREN